MAKCKDCAHFLICIQGNSNPDYCGQFMRYENTVEVVRCKDCKHYENKNINLLPHCTLCGTTKFEDDYCSCGERREGE